MAIFVHLAPATSVERIRRCGIRRSRLATAKPAGIYDEDHPIIAGNESREFVYTIGPGWLVNEYELQVQYRPREKLSAPYILSPPVSFDVTDTD